MNRKQKKLQQQLSNRNNLRKEFIKNQKQQLKDFDNETEEIRKNLELTQASLNPLNQATELWCKITNALIKKYKTMTDEDSAKAYKQLLRLEGALLAGGFLTKDELKNL